MYETSREKHTGQSIKRETEDLYKLYFKICKKKDPFQKDRHSEFPSCPGYLKCLAYSFSIMVYIYISPLYPLSNKYSIMSFHMDVKFLGKTKKKTPPN